MTTTAPVVVVVDLSPPKSRRLQKAFRLGLEHAQYQIAEGRKTPVENYNRANPYSSFAPGVECRAEWRRAYFSGFGLPSPQ